jgi:two-component system response regulator AtoC/two-component system response regulator HupR/HoxA
MKELDWKAFDVLVVDDEEDNLDAFRFAFRKSFQLHYALGGEGALEALERLDPAVIVSDQRMPGMNGIELLKRAKERRPDAFGVLLTAYADLSVLIDAVNSGAVDRYVQKPWDSKELAVILRQGIASFATVRENRRLREQLALYAGYLEREQRDSFDFGEILGESQAFKLVASRLAEVAPTSTHVLIEGEPGSEKEVVARAVHVGSPREERPFVKVTCAAFPGEMLERELFGWQRGAFDGAFADRAGRLELANGGTVHLDEPASLSAPLQARLLRLLDTGEVERVGGTEPTRIDARLVVSLTPDLAETWGRSGVARELADRLSVLPIRLPPLRERQGDVRLLAEHFLRKYARRNPRAATALSAEAVAKLEAYGWPGNVRELENVIERAAILSRGDVIQPEHLQFALGARPAAPPATAPAVPATTEPAALDVSERPAPAASTIDLDSKLDDIERRELIAALARCNGNKAEVARSLGVQRTTLYYRLKRLGIEM